MCLIESNGSQQRFYCFYDSFAGGGGCKIFDDVAKISLTDAKARRPGH